MYKRLEDLLSHQHPLAPQIESPYARITGQRCKSRTVSPEWLWLRLANIVENRPHLESSIYGPLGAFLGCIFPPLHKFLVKQQSALRKEVLHPDEVARELDFLFDIPDLPDEYLHPRQLSTKVEEEQAEEEQAEEEQADPLDSFGGTVDNRISAGDVKLPDFLIVKATESTTNDTLIAIIEVKRDVDYINHSRYQLFEYLERAALKCRDEKLLGFLVMGNRVEVYGLNGWGGDATVVNLKRNIPTIGHEFVEYLQTLAARFWA
ncbi:hypothetical protein H0H87_008588 [Tephrocybe sp. NHM501043]|nr:hypothetical protein H0H87_008588 [Tephrocybe sp. NHM501043]